MQIHYCFKKNSTGVSKSVLRKLLLLLLAYWGSTVASLLSINPPFSPTYLSITLSLLFRGRGKTRTGKKKKKDALPKYGKQPTNTLQSYLESCALPSYPFQKVCCTAHPTDVTTTCTVGKEEQHWSRKAHARQERSLLRCASLISQAPIHDQ
jgi:hypothetical protein